MGEVKRFPTVPMTERDFTTLDSLPFGAILVDEAGKILFYNRTEESKAKRKRADVLGKNFFDVAPCARVKEYRGQFLEVVKEPGFIASFHFHYSPPGRVREVEITLASFLYQSVLLCLIIASDLAS
jgi:photoactive yellow protein